MTRKYLQKIVIISVGLLIIQASMSCCLAYTNGSSSATKKYNQSKNSFQSDTSEPLEPISSINVNITNPLPNSFYLANTKILSLPNGIIVYGSIDITANVSSTKSVDRVEFYVNNRLKHTDNEAPYSYKWRAIKSLRHTIRVVAFDSTDNSSNDSIQVFKWRVHPIFLITASAVGIKILSRLLGDSLLGHTIIRGTVFNMKSAGRDVTFNAIRLRYTEFTPSSRSTGVIKFQKCRIRDTGLDRKYTIGPLGSFTFIFGIYRGSIQEI